MPKFKVTSRMRHDEVEYDEGDVVEFSQELADRCGCPGGSRAVGSALASNPWLLVVPCHRVLRADGALGGFSGGEGPSTKRALLEHERQSRAPAGSPR